MNASHGPYTSPDALEMVGSKIAGCLLPGDVITLRGPLGAGKTTLARGLIRAFCGESSIPSPTYTLVENYTNANAALWHFDLYRLNSADDIWELGIEDAIQNDICLIEWPEIIENNLPDDRLDIEITIQNTGQKNGRILQISIGDSWVERINNLTGFT